jgi:hypothetical protein
MLPVALAVVASVAIAPAEAQANQRTVYAAKFLCGEFERTGICITGIVGASCTTNADCVDPTGEGICQLREGPVKPGNYQTAVNIHNPTRKPITFVKKAVLLFSNDPANPVPDPGTFEQPLPPGPYFSAFLERNWGMEIDCPDIREVLLGMPPPTDPTVPLPFIKGYVVLETFGSREILDVVAAYTTHGFTPRFGFLCSLPGTPVDGQPCDPDISTDPCFAAGGLCLESVVGKVEEGFSTEIETVFGKQL